MASPADLLETIRRSPYDRTQREIDRILTYFDFERTEGRSHTIYIHEQFQDVRVTVPRHRVLRAYVARNAVSAIDLVEDRSVADGTDE